MNASDKVVSLLNRIHDIVKAEEDDLKELIKDFPEQETLIKYIEKFEKTLAKMLKEERKYFIQAVQQYLQDVNNTDNPLVQAIVDMVQSDMFAGSAFATTFAVEVKAFLTEVSTKLTTDIMNALDSDIPFEVFSDRTTKWIDSWSEELGTIMNNTNHKAVSDAIADTLENGKGIPYLIDKLKDLPEFDRKRARATAITEVLTASSVSQYEAYMQSPSVTGKTWRHSGGRRIKPRPHHVSLSGTTIPLDEKFSVGSYEADFPRDTALPAKERVFCHCVLGPSVDEDILGLTVAEREVIRQRTLESLGKA